MSSRLTQTDNLGADQHSIDEGFSLPLSESRIARRIASKSTVIASLEVLPSVDSTNAYLMRHNSYLGKARICLAEEQLSGRGRRGSIWYSKPKMNIMMSVSWGFVDWPETLSGLGLAVALVIAERLNRDYQLGVDIKWPNDLLINGEKLAGVLLEVSGDQSGPCNVVMGIGLNVHQPDWSQRPETTRKTIDFEDESGSDGDRAWTDLYSHGVTVDRNELTANLTIDLLDMLEVFERRGFGEFVQRWNDLSCHVNKRVVLAAQDSKKRVTGLMLGVNDSGELLIETENGAQQIVSDSSMSLRALN